mmetsp:Transcript_34405/g.78426  ORF Transcript_34405/g.78426 Transcript_34405/m.78426 type:complete len:228 (-) Transcript_34405:24-707(-)
MGRPCLHLTRKDGLRSMPDKKLLLSYEQLMAQVATRHVADLLTASAVVVGDNLWADMCSLLPMPCVYVTVVREPVSQLLSNYNYFCKEGAEGRHKWTPAQKAAGKCDTPLEEWKTTSAVRRYAGVTQPTWDDTLALAKRNLEHPCMWYLRTEQLSSDLSRLGGKLGEPWEQHFVSMNQQNAHPHAVNISAEAMRVKMQDPAFRSHVQLYSHLTEAGDKQWSRGLTMC